jgi:MerR family transcriptional regulator, light-induced transcriptional regulator
MMQSIASNDQPMPDYVGPIDQDQRRFLSELLSSRADELAALAGRGLVSGSRDIAKRWGPMPELRWEEHFRGRISDLASAVDAGRPEIFETQVLWAKQAFRARNVPISDLRSSLDQLWRIAERELPSEDARIVAVFLARGVSALDFSDNAPPTRLSTDSAAGVIAAKYMLALLEGDRLHACNLIIDAVRAGTLSVKQAHKDVLIPVQYELGRMWHLNELTVAEEHFATSATQMVMAQLLPMAQCKPRDGRAMLAASVQGNSHDLGVRQLADFFEMEGWRSIYLGANVPIPDLTSAVRDFVVDLVALSAALPAQLRTVEETIAFIRAESPKAKILVGGLVFTSTPDLWQQIGADGYAPNAEEAIRLADDLVAPRFTRKQTG